MLCIHYYRVCIICKSGSDLYRVDWLFQNNHTENGDQEITTMNLNVHPISTSVNVSVYASIEDIKAAV